MSDESIATCVNHPEIKTQIRCCRCRASLCTQCERYLNNADYCEACAQELAEQKRDCAGEGHVFGAAHITFAQGIISILSGISFMIFFIFMGHPNPEIDYLQKEVDAIFQKQLPPGAELPFTLNDLKPALLKVSAASMFLGGFLYLYLAYALRKFGNGARIFRVLLAGLHLLTAINFNKIVSLYLIATMAISLAAEIYVIVALFGKGRAYFFSRDYRLVRQMTPGRKVPQYKYAPIFIGLLGILFVLQFFFGMFA